MSEEFNAGNVNSDNITVTRMEETPEAAAPAEEKDTRVYGSLPEKPDPATLPVDEDGIKQFVTKDMMIGDMLALYPDVSLVLMRCGMHCVSCGVSQFENLEQACAVHGLEADDVAKVVNDYLTQTIGAEEN